MDDIKDFINAIGKTIPKNQNGMGDLVHANEVKDELNYIDAKKAEIEKLMKYQSADQCAKDYCLEAIIALVLEMKFGKTSTDKRLAASEILDRGMGKPVERVMNLELEASGMADEELNSKTESLLDQLFKQTGVKNPYGFKSGDKNAAVFMDTLKKNDISGYS